VFIGRIVILLWSATAAWAQLPPAQAPPPRPDPDERHERRKKKEAEVSRYEAARLDAVVSDLKGEAVTGLKTQDFSLTVNGKPQKIDTCVYRKDEPLRLVVIIDDLSLSLDNNNAARRALRAFIERLGAKDEVAILRASAGSGALDHFTSDHRELQAALDRAPYNPEAEIAAPATLAGTFRITVGRVLAGLKETPGRKAVLFVSERLRDPARNAQISTVWLGESAHLASAALYAVDMSGVANVTQLDLGLSQVVRNTGGVYYDGDRIAEALARIARDAAGYYFFTYRAEGAAFDFIAGIPKLERVQLTTPGRETVVRARNGVFGPGEVEAEYDDPDAPLSHIAGTELLAGALRARVTALAIVERRWLVNAIIHVDGNDLTFRRTMDNKYTATLDLFVALTPDSSGAAEQIARTIDLAVTEKGLALARAYGLDYTATVSMDAPGSYRLTVAARDAASGRLGTARTIVTGDWGPGKLSMTSLVLHGEDEREDTKQPATLAAQSASLRRFRAGDKITYGYELLNLAEDAEKRAHIDVRARIWRDGALVSDGAPIPLNFEKSVAAGRRAVTGGLSLLPQARAARYVLGVTVTDKTSGRTATRFMDFEVQP
jgi:VWFA-related protein